MDPGAPAGHGLEVAWIQAVLDHVELVAGASSRPLGESAEIGARRPGEDARLTALLRRRRFDALVRDAQSNPPETSFDAQRGKV